MINMKPNNVKYPKNRNELKLMKQQFRFDIQLQEKMLSSEIRHLKKHFKESAKLAVRKYAAKLGFVLAMRLIQSRFKTPN